MTLWILLFSWTFAVSLPKVNVSEFPEVKALQKDMPGPVKSYIRRKAECLHWDNQVVYDPSRIELIHARKTKIRCEQLESDIEKLKIKFKDDQNVLDVLNKTQNLAL